ncbi:MAG TPA: hypothetical protein VFB26_08335 [Gaiellaceae bacterium]|nr:hypothetical protein [Gaiellaceae bacterium]
MWAPPVVRGGAPGRWTSLLAGLALFAVGIVMLLESGLGLSPWDVLNQGIAERTPLTFGIANSVVGVCVLGGAWRLGARIGPGTVANAVLVGVLVDLLTRAHAFAGVRDDAWPLRALVLAAGIGLIGVASALYIGGALGAGPRDSLMLVLARRFGVRVGVVRALLESSVTVAGFALGGTVGVGTLAFALGIGPAIEASFWLLGRSPLAAPSPA